VTACLSLSLSLPPPSPLLSPPSLPPSLPQFVVTLRQIEDRLKEQVTNTHTMGKNTNRMLVAECAIGTLCASTGTADQNRRKKDNFSKCQLHAQRSPKFATYPSILTSCNISRKFDGKRLREGGREGGREGERERERERESKFERKKRLLCNCYERE
jgi:hypothetical protein